MESGFFAMLFRMKYINRWGLMRNTFGDNLAEHSLDTAVFAHALCAKGGIYRPENETPRVRISKAALFTADHYLRAHYSLYTSRILASR